MLNYDAESADNESKYEKSFFSKFTLKKGEFVGLIFVFRVISPL
jgi:hypothetical protein